ncbi:MAG: hypothetical protein ACOX4B_06060 [Bacillota bacterium]|jgi:hypothetical protein|nr:hypothetical protein [Candidatus Fermentithermobacillaceae bacterium]
MEALAAFPFWEDDSEDIYLETGSGSSMEESPQEGFCLDKVLQSVLYGAISAVAFAFGELAADPSKGSIDDLMNDIAWAVFGALFSEFVTCLTGNVLLSVIIVGFVTGILVVVLNS